MGMQTAAARARRAYRARKLFSAASVAALSVTIVGLVITSSAMALDESYIPEPMRVKPVTPLVDQNKVPSSDSEQLAPLTHPDYGDSATLGTPERDRLNTDATGLASDVDKKAAELTGGNREEEDALKKCVKGALWDIAWDALWDQNNNQQFSVSGELQATANRMASCFGASFNLDPTSASAVADWFMQGFIGYATDALIADPDLAGFADWALVTAWDAILY